MSPQHGNLVISDGYPAPRFMALGSEVVALQDYFELEKICTYFRASTFWNSTGPKSCSSGKSHFQQQTTGGK